MICRNGVAKNSESPGAADFFDLTRFHREILEEGRFMNVIALGIPMINVAGAGWDFVPLRVLTGKIAVKTSKNFGLEGGLHSIADFVQTRPEIAKENVPAI